MIPHIHTLFEFMNLPYENQHQILNIKEIDRGSNQVLRVYNYATATKSIRHLMLSNLIFRARISIVFMMVSWKIKGVEDGVAQSVEHWTANLATRVRSPVGEEPFDLICAFLHVQMESNWAGLSVCNCRHTGK